MVSIGGEASDLALDEPRGVLYIANFTANRIDVMSLATNTILTSINVAAQPNSISLSPNGRWLLVAHYGNIAAPASPGNALTLIDLSANNTIQTFVAAESAPGRGLRDRQQGLGGDHPRTIFSSIRHGRRRGARYDRGSQAAKTHPRAAANFPADIAAASVTVSAGPAQDLRIGKFQRHVTFRYDVASHRISLGRRGADSGTLGPRVVSAQRQGSVAMAGWVMTDSAGT